MEDYTRIFALDLPALKRRAVLDVEAGSSSYTAEANRRGIDAVAVDPMYGRSTQELGAQIRQDYGRMNASMPARPASFRMKTFPSSLGAAAVRRSAAQWFLADYENNTRHGRYVRGALPLLPFLDGAFDLVLCAQLLFVHAARFDHDWHLAACAELLRVSGGEVRIHPVCGSDGRPYAGLEHLRSALLDRQVQSTVVPVDGGLRRGRNRMLVLNRLR